MFIKCVAVFALALYSLNGFGFAVAARHDEAAGKICHMDCPAPRVVGNIETPVQCTKVCESIATTTTTTTNSGSCPSGKVSIETGACYQETIPHTGPKIPVVSTTSSTTPTASTTPSPAPIPTTIGGSGITLNIGGKTYSTGGGTMIDNSAQNCPAYYSYDQVQRKCVKTSCPPDQIKVVANPQPSCLVGPCPEIFSCLPGLKPTTVTFMLEYRLSEQARLILARGPYKPIGTPTINFVLSDRTMEGHSSLCGGTGSPVYPASYFPGIGGSQQVYLIGPVGPFLSGATSVKPSCGVGLASSVSPISTPPPEPVCPVGAPCIALPPPSPVSVTISGVTGGFLATSPTGDNICLKASLSGGAVTLQANKGIKTPTTTATGWVVTGVVPITLEINDNPNGCSDRSKTVRQIIDTGKNVYGSECPAGSYALKAKDVFGRPYQGVICQEKGGPSRCPSGYICVNDVSGQVTTDTAAMTCPDGTDVKYTVIPGQPISIATICEGHMQVSDPAGTGGCMLQSFVKCSDGIMDSVCNNCKDHGGVAAPTSPCEPYHCGIKDSKGNEITYPRCDGDIPLNYFVEPCSTYKPPTTTGTTNPKLNRRN